MAYGQKYRGYFIAETGATREIAIYEDGYTGDVVTITAYNEPNLEWNGSGKKVAGVVGLICTFQFLHTSTFNVETLFNANPRHYKAEVIDGGTVLFSGWLQSDLAKDIYAAEDRTRIFEISATDGLGDLADIDFKAPDGSIYKDRESVRAFLQYAFNLTGLGLNTVTSVLLFDSYMSNSANAINQVQIDPKAFIEDEKTVSVREVLERLCQTFYAWAYQRKGKWHFICIDAFKSATPTAYEYLPNGNQVFTTTVYTNRKLINSDGTYESIGQTVPIRTQSQLNNSIVWVEEPAQKTKTRPIKRLEVAYDYGRMKSQINGNFFGGDTTGWVFGGSIDYALVQSDDSIGSYMLRIRGAAKKDDFTPTVPPTALKTPDHLTTSSAFGYDEKYASTYFEIKKSESVKLEFEYLATEHTDVKIAVVFTYKDYKGTEKTTSNLYDDLSTIDYDGLGSDGKWYGAEKVKGGKQVRHLLVKNVATNASGDAVIKQNWETYSIESADGAPADGWVKVYFFRGCNFNAQNNNAELFIRNISFGSKDSDAVNSTTVVLDNPDTEFGDQKVQISIPFGEPVNTLNYSYLSKLNGDKTTEQWQSSGITPPSNIQAMMGAMYLRQHSKYCMVLEGRLRGDALQMGDSFTMNGFDSTVFVVTGIEGGLKTDTYSVTLMEVVTSDFEPTYYYKNGIKLNQFYGGLFVFGGSILKGLLGNGQSNGNKNNVRQGVVDAVGGEEVDNSISNNEVYKNRFNLNAPYDVTALKIGSYRQDADSWTGVTNPPNLYHKGHFEVFEAGENTKEIRYIADQAVTINCNSYRSGSLLVINGTAGSWTYYVEGSTDDYNMVNVPSNYVDGKAIDLGRKVYTAEYLKEAATLSRGTKTGAINFNKLIENGLYKIKNVGGFAVNGSTFYPPTTDSEGKFEVKSNGCDVIQIYWPNSGNNDGLLLREKTNDVWGEWFTATSGVVRKDGKIRIPVKYLRGYGSGNDYVDVYDADHIDQVTNYTAGTGIAISPDNVISYTGTTTPIISGTGIYYNPTTGAINSLITQYTDAMARAAFSAGTAIAISPTGVISYTGATLALSATPPLYYNGTTGALTFSGTTSDLPEGTRPYYADWRVEAFVDTKYVPLVRSLTVAGTAGRISISGGTQTLGANRTWTADLVSIHAGLTGGSGTQVAVPTVDIYGRVTALTATNISFPVTSVNGLTGAAVLTTTNIAEGTNLYWTNARGDARYPLLSGSYSNPSWITSLAYSKITGVPDFAGTYVPLTRSITLNGSARISISASIQTLAADRTWNFDLNTIHAGLSGGSTITTPSINVDAYGRVTSLSYSTILFPVTSVNGQSGAVSLTTTNIPEGTNLYWTNARGDARYSLLGHTHAWADITGKPDFAATYVPLTRSLTVAGTTSNIVVTGGAQTLGADRTWTVNLAALHVSPLTGGSTTQVPQITTDIYGRVTGITNANIAFPAETDPTVPSWVKAITATQISNWDVSFGWGNHALAGYLTSLPTHNHNDLYVQLAGSYANPTWITSLAYSKITGVPNFLTSYTETDPTVPNHVKAIGTGDINSWNAKLSGDGTINYVAKYSATNTLTPSQIFDNGTGVGIGTASLGGYKFRVNGAMYADGDGSAVAMYLGAGQAIRALGDMFIDAGAGNMYFRTTAGYAYSMTLAGSYVLMGTVTVNGTKTLQVTGGIRATGQMQFVNYTSSSSFTGTRAGLLGFDASGNILTVANDTFAPLVHNHDGDYYTKTQSDARYLQSLPSHSHAISDITGLQSALDNRPTWGDVYTRTQLNTSGAGGVVHWNNLTGVPSLSYAGHTHGIGDISGLQSALDNKSNNGHNHDDRYYTQGQLNTSGAGGSVHWNNISNKPSLLTSESDPWGFDSHWFSTSGSTVTLGIQRRNGSQAFANFNVPSPSPTSDYYNIERQAGSGLGSHNLYIKRYVNSSYYGFSLATLNEEDPKGVASIMADKVGSTLTITLTLRDGTSLSANVMI